MITPFSDLGSGGIEERINFICEVGMSREDYLKLISDGYHVEDIRIFYMNPGRLLREGILEVEWDLTGEMREFYPPFCPGDPFYLTSTN